MSIQMITDCWKLDLDKGEQLVLLALADHANDDGITWPGIERIAAKCGYTERGIRKVINEQLCEKGVVKKVKDGSGRGKGAVWKIMPEKGRKADYFRDTDQNDQNPELSSGFSINPELNRVNPEHRHINPELNNINPELSSPEPSINLEEPRKNLGAAEENSASEKTENEQLEELSNRELREMVESGFCPDMYREEAKERGIV